MSYYAVVEAGGTKFNCAIVDEHKVVHAECRIHTTTPEETLSQVVDFFSQQQRFGFGFDSLGLACFGPVDLHPDSPTFGYITATPKPHWSNTSVLTFSYRRIKL